MESAEEFNDIYDADRNLTGRVHRRGEEWQDGEFGLVVCVWVYDGKGRFLLTRRAPGKSFAGTWENSGGAAKAGETSIQAVVRELYEETGIAARESDFQFLDTDSDKNMFFDHYCLKCQIPVDQIHLLPGETDDVMWATYGKIHWMIRTGKICRVIANQFRRLEPRLRKRNPNRIYK